MSKLIIIVTRQNYYSSRESKHVMDMINPIVGAWESRRMVDEFFERRLKDFIANGYVYEHVNESHSIGMVERYLIKDPDEGLIVSYSVILEPLL